MDKSGKKDRRDFLFTASYTVGAIGLGATAWPLIHQMNPDRSVKDTTRKINNCTLEG